MCQCVHKYAFINAYLCIHLLINFIVFWKNITNIFTVQYSQLGNLDVHHISVFLIYTFTVYVVLYRQGAQNTYSV